MRVESITLAGGLDTVVEARQFLAATLDRWGAHAYDFGAAQVLSELATNAALHARGPYTVALRLDSGSMVIEVTDGSPRLPVRRRYARDATTGRGLRLVAAFSHSWGATAVAGGKTVWARVEPDGSGVSMFEDLEGDDETPEDAASFVGMRALTVAAPDDQRAGRSRLRCHRTWRVAISGCRTTRLPTGRCPTSC